MAQRRKALPQLPAKLDPQTRQYLSSLQEMIETGEGTRGDPLDTKLTFRDLIKSGIARLKGQIGPGGVTGDQLEPGGVPDLATPPAPQEAGFVAVFDAVTALWNDPHAAYSNHAYTEVWRADGENADFSSASLIGVSEGSMYSDYSVEGGTDYTYWIRFISTSDVRGPWHNPSGTSLQALVSVERMLEELSGNIDESVLANSFKDRLNGFQESISEQGDLYTLTLNNNGYVSGFGTYNDGKTSDFAVVADRFWVAPPNSTGKVKPFIISGGNVYIDTAFIRDASIQEGKLGPISFGKIKDRYGRPVTTVSGKLKAQNIDVDSLQVTNANISGDIYSTSYQSGASGWKLHRSGDFEINGANLLVKGRPVSESLPVSWGSPANKVLSIAGDNEATVRRSTGWTHISSSGLDWDYGFLDSGSISYTGFASGTLTITGNYDGKGADMDGGGSIDIKVHIRVEAYSGSSWSTVFESEVQRISEFRQSWREIGPIDGSYPIPIPINFSFPTAGAQSVMSGVRIYAKIDFLKTFLGVTSGTATLGSFSSSAMKLIRRM